MVGGNVGFPSPVFERVDNLGKLSDRVFGSLRISDPGRERRFLPTTYSYVQRMIPGSRLFLLLTSVCGRLDNLQHVEMSLSSVKVQLMSCL